MKLRSVLLLFPLMLGGCGQSKEKDPIFVIAAMECEHTTIYEALENKKDEIIGNYAFSKGYIDNYPVVLARSMIGMVNSATCTTIGIEHYHPRAIIVQGTSGAHNPDLHAGDMVLGENLVELGCYETVHEDLNCGTYLDNRYYPEEEMVSNGEIKRIKTLHSADYLLDIAYHTPHDGKLIKGTIGSSDMWNKELDAIKYYHDNLHTDCEEMEGFAVGQVAFQHQIDYLCIRIISNSEYYADEVFDDDAGEICQLYSIDVIKQIIKSYNNK